MTTLTTFGSMYRLGSDCSMANVPIGDSVDIMCFAFTTAAATKMSAVYAGIALGAAVTPTDGSLTDNTILNGALGDQFRLKYVTTGTYSGATSLQVDLVVKG